MSNHTLSVYPKYVIPSLITLLVLSAIPNSYSQEEGPSITITSDKDSYLPGDTVNLAGLVSGAQNPLVAVQVKDSSGNLILIRTIQADQNGNFTISFKIPPSATSGKFDITTSTRVNGFVVTQTQVITAKVPEFPLSGVVLFIAGIIPIILYRTMRQTGSHGGGW